MSTINVTAVNIPALKEITLQDKTILTGPNGAGKSTIIRCIEAALNGETSTGKLADISSGKPSVTVTHNGEVVGRFPGGSESNAIALSLKALASLTGPQRAAKLFELLGGRVSSEEIKAVVEETVASDLRHLFNMMSKDDIDLALRWVNTSKKESDKRMDGLRAVQDEAAAISEDVATARLKELKEKFGRLDQVEERARTEREIASVTEELGEYKDREPAAVDAKVAGWKRERDDLREQVSFANDEIIRADNEIERLEALASRGDGKCPTCGHVITAEETTALRSALDKLKARRDDRKAGRKPINEKLAKYDNAIAKAYTVLKNLSRLYDLREYLKTLPVTQHTAEEIAAGKSAIDEYETALRIHEANRRNARKLREIEAEAKAFRAAENSLKALKTKAASAAGFPAHVTSIVHDILGLELRFEKNDITVFDGKVSRSIATLSGGEWAVVSAAFAALRPESWILLEAAEIDESRLARVLTALTALPNPVIVAHWANFDIEGYTKVEVTRG